MALRKGSGATSWTICLKTSCKRLDSGQSGFPDEEYVMHFRTPGDLEQSGHRGPNLYFILFKEGFPRLLSRYSILSQGH